MKAYHQLWAIEGKLFRTKIVEGVCPLCLAVDSIVALPPPLLKKQPDNTTHVCHPMRGGCNHGFAEEPR